MKASKLILLTALILIIVVVGYYVYKDAGAPVLDPGAVTPEQASELVGKRLVLFILGGLATGILILMFVIPWVADVVGNYFYTPAEESDPDPSSLAVAKIAQGDYEGAIDEYKKLVDERPADRFPVMEIAKLHLEKLNDAEAAIDFLEDSLNDKEWPVDDAAFIMFRIIDLELEHRNNPARARELLIMVKENFEGTRHAANADHRIEQIDKKALF